MDPEVVALFHALADLSPSERDEYCAQRQVPSAIRAEVESLLGFDVATAASLRPLQTTTSRALVEDGFDRGSADLVGAVIGRYRITEKIGEGGMGVVYRAEDLSLRRSVAIKAIGDRFNESAEARARFLLEARSVAALNHPNICTIHEVLEVDDHASVADSAGVPVRGPLIVLELVEGETVQQRLARAGTLPLRDLLSIARQVAEGLAEAHRLNIVHRDLKPGNIMVTPAGRVKILDFGLAKSFGALPDVPDATGAIDRRPAVETASLAGTFAYMSPEQAEGRPLDSRSDQFAFGTVLYELACRCRPFPGDTREWPTAPSEAADPPSILRLRSDLPPALDAIVRRCLRRRPDDRYSDTQDLVDDLTALERTASPGSLAVAARGSWGKWRAAAVFLLIAGVLVAVQLSTTLPPASPPAHPAPTHRQVTFVGDASYPAISPDGRLVAYVRGEPWGETSSVLLPRNRQKVVIEDVSGAGRVVEIGDCIRCRDPRWAPDGSAVLVADADREIVLFSTSGGERRRYALRGVAHLAWSPDGKQFAATGLPPKAIALIDAATDRRTELPLNATTVWLRALEWSPDGRWIAVLTHDEEPHWSIWVVARDGNRQEHVVQEDSVLSGLRWDRSGSIYFLRQRAQVRELWKVRVSPESGRPAEPPKLVLGGLQAGPNFAVSTEGRTLVYTREIRYSNLWIAAAGRTPQARSASSRQITSGTLSDNFPAISPDGASIAFVRSDGRASNVFVMPFSAGPARQLTFLHSVHSAPAWSPDGSTVAFCAAKGGTMNVWTIPAAGGAPRVYGGTRCTNSTTERAVSWVEPGTLLYQRPGNRNYHVLNLASASEAPLVRNEAAGWLFAPHLSPDGSQLAVFWNHQSRGRGLFVFPWPARENVARRLAHAAMPMAWSPDSRSIYAYDDTAAKVVEIHLDGTAPTLLADLSAHRVGLLPAISPDRQHVVFSAHAIHADVWLAEDFDSEKR